MSKKYGECEHGKMKPTRATKEVAGLVFEYKSKECQECGAILWNDEIDELFKAWLAEQKSKHRDHFTIQDIQLPLELYGFALAFGKRFSLKESDVFRSALAAYYTHSLDIRSKVSNKKLPKFESGEFVTKKLRTNPIMFLRIEADAKLFGMYKGEVVSEVLKRVLYLALKNEVHMRERLEDFLFAA
jgi:hypothetical protein